MEEGGAVDGVYVLAARDIGMQVTGHLSILFPLKTDWEKKNLYKTCVTMIKAY